MLQEKTAIRLRSLMLSRVAIVTLLLGIAIFMHSKGEAYLPEISLRALYGVIITSYILSLLYYFLPRLVKNVKTNLYVQVIGDVAMVTGLVYATGGISSIYPVFYTLVIIYSVLFLGRRGGLITASACSICYGLLLDLEYYKFLTPPYTAMIRDYPFAASYVFSRIITYIVSFYLIAFLAIFIVEQEKKTRTLLREKETAFDQLDVLHRSIIESVDTGILTINRRGQIKSFNRAAEEITGFSFDEIENRNIADLFPAYGDFVAKIRSGSSPEPERSRVEIQIDSREKKPLTLGCSLSFLNDGQGKRIGDIIVFQDLTAVKKMEASLEKNKKLAFIGEMAAGLAHEIRNPLASIGGSIQVLNKSLALSKADERLMQIILRGKDQLESFMRDFLLLSRPSPGKPEDIRITDMIEEVLESMRRTRTWPGRLSVRAFRRTAASHALEPAQPSIRATMEAASPAAWARSRSVTAVRSRFSAVSQRATRKENRTKMAAPKAMVIAWRNVTTIQGRDRGGRDAPVRVGCRRARKARLQAVRDRALSDGGRAHRGGCLARLRLGVVTGLGRRVHP